MNITTIPVSKINPAEYNPRSITKDEFSGLKTSLKTFGQQENLIVNKDMTLISGHQRLEAMKALGWDEAVCNVVDLDKHEEKKLNVLMNSQAISGKWDDLKLAEILEELKLDDNYEALRLNELEPLDLSPTEVEEDEAPEVSQEPPVSKLGEIYQLGRHRVMCGDSTEDIEKLLNGTRANMAFTDPPYNVDYGSNQSPIWGKSRTILNDKMSDEDWLIFIDKFNKVLVDNTDGGIYIAMSCKELDRVKQSFENVGGHWSSYIIWVKQQLVPGRKDYQSKYEPILYGWREGLKDRYFKDSRKETDVWEHDRPSRSEEHPTMKPLSLVIQAINDSSKLQDVVLDTFLGSGSTLIACEQTDRTCYGMELDPKYVDVIRKRYAKFIGKEEEWQEVTPLVDQVS